MSLNELFRFKSTKTSSFGEIPVLLAKSDKTTFLGQIRPKQVFHANIGQNHIVQAEKQKNENSQIETEKI